MAVSVGTLQKSSALIGGRARTLLPPGPLGLYILSVGIVGIGLVAYGALNLPLGRPEILFALFVLIFALESAPIKLTGTPLRGSNLSVGAAIAFAALLIFGPSGAILINLGSALAYWLHENRPFYKRFFTTMALVASSATAGLVYVLAGGRVPIGPEMRNVIAAGLAAVAYFIANSCLISGAVSLQTKRAFREVMSNWRWLFLQMFTTLAVGVVMALAYAGGLGSPLFLFVPIMLIFPWYSIYFHVQKSRQIAEQHERIAKSNAELESANMMLDQRLQGLKALQDIGISLNNEQGLPAILNGILSSVVKLAGADTSAVFLDQGGQNLTIAGQIGLSPQYMEAPEMALDGSAVRAMRERQVLVLDRTNYHQGMLSGAAQREGIRSTACLPLRLDGAVIGGLEVCFKSEHMFSEDELSLLKTLAEQAAVAIHNERLTEQIHESYLSTIRALAATVEARDRYTRGHSEVVRQLAAATGRQLGLPPREIELLNIGALFHDLGKIGIPESILNKPGGLNADEWERMREHPLIGERILSKVPALADVLPLVRNHHERFDGRGYPDGIPAGKEPMAAIIAICDSYQAMVSDRPYRKALGHEYAIEEIRRKAGSQFVPELAEAFVVAADNIRLPQSASSRFEPALLLRIRNNHRDGEAFHIEDSSASGAALVRSEIGEN